MSPRPRQSISGKEICKCGHPRFSHCNDPDGRRNRGKCVGNVRQFIRPIEGVERHPSDRQLTQPQAEAALQKLSRKDNTNNMRLHRVMVRGFIVTDCECPTFHTVDIGQVLIHKPGGTQ